MRKVSAISVILLVSLLSGVDARRWDPIRTAKQRQTSNGLPGLGDAAEMARWITHEGSWGYVTSLDTTSAAPNGAVLSFSDVSETDGRLFFYIATEFLPSGSKQWDASLTISQAALNSTTSCDKVQLDPEDPRCAKITFSGAMTLVDGEAAAAGKAALFARHPQMKSWPEGHGFAVFQLNLADIWMIDFYGGGAHIPPDKYYAAKPRHNVPHWPPAVATDAPASNLGSPSAVAITTAPPPWKDYAARARWVVYHSLWTSVGTVSVRLNGKPWGNVRSVADGVGANSTGVPVLYVPTPDPTMADIEADPRITLSFSEAALADRVTAKGVLCGGMDEEDPQCGRLHLHGTARALESPEEVGRAEVDLGARHPFAPWLAEGGAHTGGKYFTIDVKSLVFLDYYGGAANLTVAEYLAQPPPQ